MRVVGDRGVKWVRLVRVASRLKRWGDESKCGKGVRIGNRAWLKEGLTTQS